MTAADATPSRKPSLGADHFANPRSQDLFALATTPPNMMPPITNGTSIGFKIGHTMTLKSNIAPTPPYQAATNRKGLKGRTMTVKAARTRNPPANAHSAARFAGPGGRESWEI